MNYQHVYNRLVTSAQQRNDQPEVGYETHHIIPRSHGGSDKDDNLVVLTYREHLIAHKLLYKIHQDSAMACALNYMLQSSRYNTNSHTYALARRSFVENHPMLREDVRMKVQRALAERKQYWQSLTWEQLGKKLVDDINLPNWIPIVTRLDPCLWCGKYIIRNKHWERHYCSSQCHASAKMHDGYGQRQSQKLQQYLSTLTDDQKKERMKKARSSPYYKKAHRGAKISATKQQQVDRIQSMSDDEFYDKISTFARYRKDGGRNGNLIFWLHTRGVDVDTYFNNL